MFKNTVYLFVLWAGMTNVVHAHGIYMYPPDNQYDKEVYQDECLSGEESCAALNSYEHTIEESNSISGGDKNIAEYEEENLKEDSSIDITQIEDSVYKDERLQDSENPEIYKETIARIVKKKIFDKKQEIKRKENLEQMKSIDPCEVNKNSALCILQGAVFRLPKENYLTQKDLYLQTRAYY